MRLYDLQVKYIKSQLFLQFYTLKTNHNFASSTMMENLIFAEVINSVLELAAFMSMLGVDIA